MVKPRLLVTGSNGFIGSHLAKWLLSDYEVIGVDCTPAKSSLYEFIQHDLKMPCDFLPDVDMVIHLAGANGTKHFYTRPFDTIKNNIIPTIRLLERYDSVKRFIYAGTPESHAGAVDLCNYPIPTDEKCPTVIADPTNLRWSYAGSKSLGEQAVIASGVPWTIIRYNNVFGPDQIDHFIPEFVERVQQGQYQLHGWENTRSFMYIDDACEVTKRLITTELSVNQIVNVGNSQETTILEVAQYILQCLGQSDQSIELHSAPAGSVSRRCPDVNKMKTLTGYDCQYTWQQGIEKMLKGFSCT